MSFTPDCLFRWAYLNGQVTSQPLMHTLIGTENSGIEAGPIKSRLLDPTNVCAVLEFEFEWLFNS